MIKYDLILSYYPARISEYAVLGAMIPDHEILQWFSAGNLGSLAGDLNKWLELVRKVISAELPEYTTITNDLIKVSINKDTTAFQELRSSLERSEEVATEELYEYISSFKKYLDELSSCIIEGKDFHNHPVKLKDILDVKIVRV